MPNDEKIFRSVQKAREEIYKAQREVRGKNELYFTASQHKLMKRFTAELKGMCSYLDKVFNKDFDSSNIFQK